MERAQEGGGQAHAHPPATRSGCFTGGQRGEAGVRLWSHSTRWLCTHSWCSGAPLLTPASPSGQGRVRRDTAKASLRNRYVLLVPAWCGEGQASSSKATRPTPPLLSPLWFHSRPPPEHNSQGREVAHQGGEGRGWGRIHSGKHWCLHCTGGRDGHSPGSFPPHPLLSLRMEVEGPQFPRGS